MEPVAYRISEADHITLMRMFQKRALPRFAMFMAIVVALVFVVAVPLGLPEAGYSAAVTALVIVPTFALFARYVTIPRKAARAFRDYALIREEMTLSLTGEGFAITQASGHVAMAWSDVLMWDENDRILAIHPTGELAYILPKQAIGRDRVDFIRQHLVDYGLSSKGKRRK
ncbi:YcxB family protein [Erythrobacter donghaensis]|uniref:YcxB family protein n=1 Tax=Erythrobacter donghaensis TaxID=267135 RepID=UPI000A3BFEED|nr:YcxB family protein [Erythrobacter donghaensis]